MDYDDKDKPIPFRRRVFSSRLDGKRITGKDVEDLIDSDLFKKLDDDDAVSLCCIGILQLVLLGLEDKRPVPNWILRLANDRDGWDDYPWGSYVWPTLYYSLKDANVKRWLPLYATQSTNEDKKKTYSLLGFTWAFKELNVDRDHNREIDLAFQHYGLSDLSGFQSIQMPAYTPTPNWQPPNQLHPGDAGLCDLVGTILEEQRLLFHNDMQKLHMVSFS
ncbi:hypothetical protein Tco_0538568 [Tanacetum coccineum]